MIKEETIYVKVTDEHIDNARELIIMDGSYHTKKCALALALSDYFNEPGWGMGYINAYNPNDYNAYRSERSDRFVQDFDNWVNNVSPRPDPTIIKFTKVSE